MRNVPSKPWLRRIGGAIAVATSLCAGAAVAAESVNDFPSRPIHIVSGFAPGGATDVLGRLLGNQLSRLLNTSVVIDNKPGASGNIGAAYVARSEPDGYTIYLANATIAMPSLFGDLPFDVSKDFAPLALIGDGASVLLANPKAPFKSVKGLIAYAKERHGKVDYGSGGVGNITHMTMELFIFMSGVKLTHIPYKGGSPANAAVLSGEVPIAFSSVASASRFIKQGSMVPLAVSTRERSRALPDVPTVAEAGVPGYEASSWYGILAPAATPKPIQDKLIKALSTALKSKEIQDALFTLGVDWSDMTGADFKQYIDREIVKWDRIIKQANIVAQ